MEVRATYVVLWKGNKEILYSTPSKYYVTESGKLVEIPDSVAWKLYE